MNDVNPENAPTPAPSQPPLPQMPQKVEWGDNKKMIARIVIVAVILVGAVIYAKTVPPAPKTTDLGNVNTAISNSSDKTPKITVTDGSMPDKSSETAKTVRAESDAVVVVAQKGNGYTHLARTALAEYLKNKDTSGLTAEHKIYIEDYLQKSLQDKTRLHTGDEVSFANPQIENAIEQAQKLTSVQLSNLHQYAVKVPALR